MKLKHTLLTFIFSQNKDYCNFLWANSPFRKDSIKTVIYLQTYMKLKIEKCNENK